MATTPNYGWVTPAPTDFVTDLPADFETFADAVDADLAGLLGGTTGQVLTKDSNSDHDFSWQTGGVAAESWTLLNAGGTALTGAGSVTVSSINGYNKYYFLIEGASSSVSQEIFVRFNGDTGSNYKCRGGRHGRPSSYGNNVHNETRSNFTEWQFGTMSDAATSTVTGYIYLLNGASTTAPKLIQSSSMAAASGGVDYNGYELGGIWDNNAAITSVTVLAGGGNLDAGTLFIYATTS